MPHADSMFGKTERGRAEIAGGQTLARRARGALILVDGKTPWSALREKFAAFGEPEVLLKQLLAEGFLAQVETTAAATPAEPAEPAEPEKQPTTRAALPGYRSGQFRM